MSIRLQCPCCRSNKYFQTRP